MRLIQTDSAPAAIGPYSQAVSESGWLYTAGQVGLDPSTGEMVGADFTSQAQQVFTNLLAVLSAAGCAPGDVVKATVFIADFANFPELNELYGDFMGAHRPARSTVQVAGLPKDALVEIDLVARIPPVAV